MQNQASHNALTSNPLRKKKLYERLNEVHFVELDEFRQMAPTIVQLEISRLSELLGLLDAGSDEHTALVAVRYHLNLFLEDLDRDSTNLEQLNSAILCLVIPQSGIDEAVRDTMVYIGDRLGYILQQMKRLR